MKVQVNISDKYREAEAEIRADKMTKEVEAAVDFLQNPERIITAWDNEKMIILKPEQIYMARVENEKAVLYTQKNNYISGKRLYELQELLGSRFMRISKSALVNLDKLDHVETEFGGMMLLTMKNGSSEYVSRHYLPEFKKYLGL